MAVLDDARLHKAAGKAWFELRDEVVTLAASPPDAVLFALLALKDLQLVWNLATHVPWAATTRGPIW